MKALKSQLAKRLVRFDYERMLAWDADGREYRLVYVPTRH